MPTDKALLADLLKALAEIEMDFGVADLHIGFVKLDAVKVKNIIECARHLRNAAIDGCGK